MENTFEKADELAQNLKDYVQTRLHLLKLEFAEKVSGVAAKLIAFLVVTLFLFLSWAFLNVALGFYLSQVTGSGIYGFMIVSGFNLLVGLCIWMAKDKLIRIPIMNAIITQLYKNDEE